ncbi:MAG: cytochrome-c oxidase, cbb3-type subunit III [Pseudomonadales bacterium]|nr:cytochrome-c oxidase, cbb3-type subunit III [Pseudomonadales bacterium]
MSTFWSVWIIAITLFNIFGCLWLLWWTRKKPEDVIEEGENTLGHEFDGIEEYNNPLPKWWLNLFYFTIAFSLIYLLLFPGYGSYPGVFGWTSANQWEREVETADNTYNRIFRDYAKSSIEELANNPEAVKVGQRLYGNNCSVCHGSDAKGSKGFPNLTDNDWLYGGTPEAIKTTLIKGRNGNMPPMIAAVGGEQGAKDVAAYVLSLSGQTGSGDAEAGKAKFMVCAACHGMDGKGNQAMGAPNLTDNIWLYGNSEEAIIEAIAKGRRGQMPAFEETLSPEKIHVISAYVYSLSQ